MNYGLPYMGSKNSIVEWVIGNMPKAEHFYDLFCGGCAITHGALLTNKFKYIHANDLNPFSMLFLDAIKGKYHNENRWISREEFEAKKDSDAYIAMVWSFGNNNNKGYLYSPENEKIKHALWDAIMFNDYTLADKYGIPFKKTNYTNTKNRRLAIMAHWKKYIVPKIKKGQIKIGDERAELASLERLERLASLERLERLESLERFTMSTGKYSDVKIKPNSLIYCDIPYRGTVEYTTGSFDHQAFYEWALSQKELVMVSEYSMPNTFTRVASVSKRGILSSTANNKVIEGIYVPNSQVELWEKLTGKKAEKIN